MMKLVFKMMNAVSKMMNFVFKMMILYLSTARPVHQETRQKVSRKAV